MCGIVAYIGPKNAYPILIKGLKRLEYRGYDSAGVALLNGSLQILKKEGKVSDLENFVAGKSTEGTVGIGHTRWATHGEPCDRNAHPHLSNSGNLAIIHNGIIENYAALKTELELRGYTFESDTDTEVLLNLIEDIQKEEKISTEEAVRVALNEVVGAYAIVVIEKSKPDTLIAARKGSPLVIGIGKGEFFVASDASPIIEYTKNVVYLNDEEFVVLHRDGNIEIKTLGNIQKTPYIQKLEMDLEKIEKGGYDYFMLKEIYEQPQVIRDCMRGRMNAEKGWIKLGGISEFANRINNAKRIIITACGTSWHSGLIAEYLIEELARIPVEVEYASEFRYRNPIVNEKDVVIAISQSGETADTLSAIQIAKDRQALIYGICNVIGSSIARASHAGSYTHAGPEIGVASTKAFSAQVTILTLLALQLAQSNGSISQSRLRQILYELEAIPSKVEGALKTNDKIVEIAKKYKDAKNFLYLGRGLNFPVALEGALKLKEISYIHAEGYPAAEMKHGPIALIDENMPVVFIATNQSAHEKIVSNIQEVKARKGKVIAIVLEGDTVIRGLADEVIEVPETDELLSPLVSIVPLQLLSYHIALMRGCNVDQPRNLAKSVTVE
ncbi:MAG: glutamine--fructose-6-phosphate transaminase (isomerizing) [Bacteroidetes bacterium]|nr:glutamine--fructose-6-phosphate transaminase (isomerizing) [Bacteroidota bacterium]MBK7040484.1 glutamine--fructose-6-phosphate transaminase (isomerizing) [Bacteroidota bacterium]MBK8328302.1 glutamine--fructose-6-phosphate transaminase (isomerizing) [Bacteroidota bacterium]MBK9482856.1 glutamine--fructose-6-phosphate transaminase (isomerizing) [Bacteroidota bacterium]